eukprot:TRINITY_DN331_c0_g5_i1.p1 TRINITY_DN331_c0_g5~~TRINITY_DN331_c0_g5_i1.p1  ORF type:complete len:174 (-),score=11.10 TRINITY_DN331_c0_g5_i1:3-524(-)
MTCPWIGQILPSLLLNPSPITPFIPHHPPPTVVPPVFFLTRPVCSASPLFTPFRYAPLHQIPTLTPIFSHPSFLARFLSVSLPIPHCPSHANNYPLTPSKPHHSSPTHFTALKTVQNSLSLPSPIRTLTWAIVPTTPNHTVHYTHTPAHSSALPVKQQKNVHVLPLSSHYPTY